MTANQSLLELVSATFTVLDVASEHVGNGFFHNEVNTVIAKGRSAVVSIALMIAVSGCGGSGGLTESATSPASSASATQTISSPASSTSPTSTPASLASNASPTPTPSPPTPEPASAITHPPNDTANVNEMHEILRSEEGEIRFGTQADPGTVTLGPTDGGFPDYPAYDGKNSLNFKMPLMTPTTAPIDMQFVGFKNRSAIYRQDTPESSRMEPFDDLELCFESTSADWPGMIVCVYHLKTSPLLQAHLKNDDCGIQEKWDGGGAEKGRIYYLENSSDGSHNNPESCNPLLGTNLNRGDVLGCSGQVEENAHSGFRFKVRSHEKNPLTNQGDPYLHWVQPTAFFYWQCFDPDTEFEPGVLAYPFDCGLLNVSE